MRIAALPAVAAVALAVGAPSAAEAAQGFVGLTNHAQVVGLSDETLPAVTTPVPVRGLRAGDALVAVDRAPSGALLALGRSSAIYTLDAAKGTVREELAPFAGTIRADAPVTFSIAPDGATARVSAPRVDVVVNLTSGTTSTAPPLAYAPGDPNSGRTPALAADTLPDGRIVGFDAAAGTFVVQHTVNGPLTTSTKLPDGYESPTRLTVTSDGSAWLVARLPAGRHQSRMVRFEPATGRLSDVNGPYLLRELVALGAVGPVRADTRPPTATMSVPRRESIRGIRAAGGVVARVRVSEGGQTLVTVRGRNGQVLGFGFGTRDDAGPLTITSFLTKAGKRLGRLLGTRAQLRFTVHDFAGHKRVYERSTTLVR